MPFLRASEVFGKKKSADYLDEFKGKQLVCACTEIIQESITGCRRLGDGTFACSDCYYENLGEALEAYPIGPRRLARRVR